MSACQIRAFAYALALLALLVLIPGVASAKPPPKSSAGAAFGPILPRPKLPWRLCDPMAPVCVHATRDVRGDDLKRVRASLAGAWLSLFETLRLPRPLSDGRAGGDPRFDLYLVSDEQALDDGLGVFRDPLDLLLDRDASPGYAVIGRSSLARSPCALDALIARALVRVAALGLDVAETKTVVDGFAAHMADVVTACAGAERRALEEVQRAPYKSIVASPAYPQVFARYLDRARGKGYGAIVPGLLSMAVQHRGIVIPTTPDKGEPEELGPVHFHDDPSIFDVLAATMSDAGTSLDGLLLEAASARVAATPGPLYEWTVLASSLPRRLAIRRGIEATGATYLRIDLDATPPGNAVELDLEWEQGGRFRWTLLKLDAQNVTIGMVPVAALESTRKVTIEARKLEGVAALVLVGVNTGDPLFPFRPDDPQGTPHGYEVGIYAGGP